MDLCKTSACIAGRTYEASYHINGDDITVVSDLGIGRGKLGGVPDTAVAKMLLRDLALRYSLENG